MQDPDSPSDKKEAIQTLMDFLTPILVPCIKKYAKVQEAGMVSYQDLWQLFPPSEVVVAKLWDLPVICRVVQHEVEDGFFDLTCEYVDWDGRDSGLRQETFRLGWFQGLVHVNSLEVYPLSFHKDPDALKERLLQRGRKWERLRGCHQQVYKGKMMTMLPPQEDRIMEGRVMIDAFAYYSTMNVIPPYLRDMTYESDLISKESTSRSPSRSSNEIGDSNEIQSTGDPSPSSFVHVDLPSTQSADDNGRDEDLIRLTDAQCLMTDPRILGFDLKSKIWGLFNIDDFADIEWNHDAFANLVIPEDDKQLAWEFVKSKAASKGEFDDFIKDKGRGLCILMFGPPGVGKTYTAEAVSEKAKVPLYHMSANMLGTSPSEIAKNLDNALSLCKLWNAMLLLDEADVFMAVRAADSISRNELVSIFLTKLEFYPGILFLTTNRASDIDFAFQSRVDLFLPYHELGPEARRKIWTNFINRAGRERFVSSSGSLDGDLDRLSQLSLNGREIKNLVKTSQMLSRKDGGMGSMDKLYLLAEKRVRALKLLAKGEP